MRRKNNNTSLLAKCAACNGNIEQSRLTVLEEQEQKTTFHVTCPTCGTFSIIFLSVSQGGIVGVGVATDLDNREAARLLGRDAVSSNEIIDMYRLVANHKGNITDLVKKFD